MSIDTYCSCMLRYDSMCGWPTGNCALCSLFGFPLLVLVKSFSLTKAFKFLLSRKIRRCVLMLIFLLIIHELLYMVNSLLVSHSKNLLNSHAFIVIFLTINYTLF